METMYTREKDVKRLIIYCHRGIRLVLDILISLASPLRPSAENAGKAPRHVTPRPFPRDKSTGVYRAYRVIRARPEARGNLTFMATSSMLVLSFSMLSLLSSLSLSWLLRRGGTGGDDADAPDSELSSSSFCSSSRAELKETTSSELVSDVYETGLRGAGGGGR